MDRATDNEHQEYIDTLIGLGLPKSWATRIAEYLSKEVFYDIGRKVAKERSGHVLHPSREKTFRAFEMTPVEKVRVILLGQDPYHNSVNHQEVATGLCFESGVPGFVPPSLRNIYTELQNDVGVENPNLSSWASQGVLMLNSALTVRDATPESHMTLWEPFTEAVFDVLSEQTGLIYVLWGRKSQRFKPLINPNFNYIIESPHPSPFSAYTGFFGSKPFSTINEILFKINNDTIKW